MLEDTTGTPQTKAVIYCRSATRSPTNADDQQTAAQEARCREFAKSRGYSVEHVFRDDGVSGTSESRLGLDAMLAFLQASPRASTYVVVIDDVARLSSSFSRYVSLREMIAGTGASLESPSVDFGAEAQAKLLVSLRSMVAQHLRQRRAHRCT